MTEHVALPCILMLSSASMLTVQGIVIYRGLRTRHWPQVPGRITWLPEARYEYEVDNQSYESTRVSYSTSSPSWTRLPLTMQPGQTVTVFYDPSNPSRSVLRPGVPTAQLIFYAGYAGPALLVFAVSVRMLYAALR
jgi:Protein of unknown function (DUF3592)